MLIRKIQVEGGFLQGLEAEFTPGLNTIIGSRGTGKSSLIELIKYSLGVKSHIKKDNPNNDKQAIQVLEDGIVTLTVDDGDLSYELVSTANRASEKPSFISKIPLIFSQTDIENIGLDQQSKISLIDGFIENKEYIIQKKKSIKDQIIKICEKITSLHEEIERIDDNKKKEDILKNEIKNLKSMQTGYDKLNTSFVFNNDKLNLLNKELSSYHIDEERLKQFNTMITTLCDLQYKSIDILSQFDETPKPKIAEESLTDFKNTLFQDLNRIKDYVSGFKDATEKVRINIGDSINKLAEESFKVRKEIEHFESGSSEINRKIMHFSTNLSLVQAELEGSTKKYEALKEEKDKLTYMTEQLTLLDEEIFKKREKVVEDINDNLNGFIKIKGMHANNTLMYEDAFEICFRSSSTNLKYKDILSDLASIVSKKELLKIIYNQDVDSISLLLGTTKQRSVSILSAFSFNSIAKILIADIEDTFDFFLLDNGTYKPFSHLSVGQRCTVVLPIILQNENQVVILDQPEDHIDNAFIAETLIPSIKKCANSGQLIIITHNANIPVLGSAKNIIHLESDGRRGYIRNSGDLNNRNISETISNIMEGGHDAFNIRAGFYSK